MSRSAKYTEEKLNRMLMSRNHVQNGACSSCWLRKRGCTDVNPILEAKPALGGYEKGSLSSESPKCQEGTYAQAKLVEVGRGAHAEGNEGSFV